MVRVVYSTGPGGGSKKVAGTCRPATVAVVPAASHAVRVRRERSGRKGKTVTVAAPLFVERDEARAILKELKRSCGSGGALKEAATADGRACFSLELQGDHVAAVADGLVQRGYPAKGAGG